MTSVLPWTVEFEDHRTRKLITIVSQRGVVCRVGDTSMPGALQDAEYIVLAANAHEGLVKACEFTLAIAENRIGGTWDDVMREMRRVLEANR